MSHQSNKITKYEWYFGETRYHLTQADQCAIGSLVRMGSFGWLFWKNKAKFLVFLCHPKHGNQEHLRYQQVVSASSLFWQRKPERDPYKKHTEPHSTQTLIEDNQRKDNSWYYQLHIELAMNIPYPASLSNIFFGQNSTTQHARFQGNL
jgi:hypothetical protein